MSTGELLDVQLANDVMQAVIARHRQLGAHETGHTLGLAHNFMGSVYASQTGGGSVMDYPPPIVTLDGNGYIVLNNNSYGDGIGWFDKVSIGYGYMDLNLMSATYGDGASGRMLRQESELDGIKRMLDMASAYNGQEFVDFISSHERAERQLLIDYISAQEDKGYIYLTDQNADDGDGDWRDSVWDSGTSAVDELKQALLVRRASLAMLNVTSIPFSTAISALQDSFVIVYLWHRYEAVTAAKILGGIRAQYPVRGDPHTQRVQPVAALVQTLALQTLTCSLSPSTLTPPVALLPLMEPLAFGYTNIEFMPGHSGDVFDPLGGVEVASLMVMDVILDSARTHRLCVQHSYDPNQPSLFQVLRNITFEVARYGYVEGGGVCQDLGMGADYFYSYSLVQLTIISVWVDSLARAYANTYTSPLASAVIGAELDYIADTLQSVEALGAETQTYVNFIASKAAARSTVLKSKLAVPLGPPI